MLIGKCFNCDGTGLVSRPPWVPGDQPYWFATNTIAYTCKSCDGRGYFIPDSITQTL